MTTPLIAILLAALAFFIWRRFDARPLFAPGSNAGTAILANNPSAYVASASEGLGAVTEVQAISQLPTYLQPEN